MTPAPPACDTLTPLFRPRSVAIIGASDDPARISGRPVRYLREGGFKGPIFPVNPKRAVVQGPKSYAAIADLPEVPDVALVAVPAELTLDAVRQCAGAGVKAAVLFLRRLRGDGRRRGAGAGRNPRHRARRRHASPRTELPRRLQFRARLLPHVLERPRPRLPSAGPIAVVSQSGAYGAHISCLAQGQGAVVWTH
jgi:acyl-CoA synthetase (NDP forming)